MNHDTLQDLMSINNDKLWTSQEKKDIIENACQKFLSKRRTKRAAEPPSKTPWIEAHVDSSSEDTESDSETDKNNNTDTDWLPRTLTWFC